MNETPMSKTKLKGMRDLSEGEINMMNEIADQGNKFSELIHRMESANVDGPNQRWLSIGRTYLQLGIMCLKRAIGKPENF